MKLNTRKLAIIYETLKKEDIDLWMILGSETAMVSKLILEELGDLVFF